VIVIVGTVRIDPDMIEVLRPAMEAMVAASRAEPGCIDYAYAHDLLEPGLIRVSEAWTSNEALAEHFTTPHMAIWRQALTALGPLNRHLTAYEVQSKRAI
jgi:quinol monooxygenase YgiN